MKNLLLALFFLMSANAFSNEYECRDKNGQGLIQISMHDNRSEFKYSNNNQVVLNLKMPLPKIIHGNNWETDRKYLNFNPGWGESTVNIYVRISERDGSLFDIYVKGMAGNFVGLLTNYKCEEL